MPYIKADTIEKFIDGFFKSKKGIGCTEVDSILMIPAVFNMEYKKELMSLVGDFGAKSVIMFHMNDVFLFHA
jgi:molybdenum cofactor cytidylyltransferase